MAAEINTELKIPDIWYDFYSSFQPGVLFIAYLKCFEIKDESILLFK